MTSKSYYHSRLTRSEKIGTILLLVVVLFTAILDKPDKPQKDAAAYAAKQEVIYK